MGLKYTQISPRFEGTLKNVSITFTLPDGQFIPILIRDDPEYNWVSEFKLTPSGTSDVVPGADGWPRAHTETIYKPKFSLTVPSDMGVAICDFAALVDGTGDLLIDKRAPHSKISVYKFVYSWKPEQGEEKGGGTVTMVEIGGNALRFDNNYKKSILPK